MEDLELGPRLDHEGVAVLAQQEDLPVVAPRRRGEAVADLEAPAAVDLLPGGRVVREQEAAVEQGVVDVVVDQRGGVVGAQQRIGPHHVRVLRVRPAAREPLLQPARDLLVDGDVAGRTWLDGVDRAQGAARVPRADVDEPVARERARRGQQRHSPELPQQPAVEVVGADPPGRGGHDLGAQGVLPDEWSRPGVPGLVALDPPHVLAGRGVERGQERLRGVVVEDVEPAVVQRRRRRGGHRLHGVERPDVAAPDLLALEVEGRHQPDGPEVDVDALAVGDRGLRGVAVLEVPGDLGHRAMELARPPHRPRLEVDVVHQPPVLAVGRDRPVVLAGVVEAGNRLHLVVGRAHRGGDEDVVPPDDRRAPAQPREIDLPGDVLGLAPAVGQGGVVGHVAGAQPTELRPVLGGRVRGGGQQHADAENADQDALHRVAPSPPMVALGFAWRPTNPPGVRAVLRPRPLARQWSPSASLGARPTLQESSAFHGPDFWSGPRRR